jgi:hypothetical protein
VHCLNCDLTVLKIPAYEREAPEPCRFKVSLDGKPTLKKAHDVVRHGIMWLMAATIEIKTEDVFEH